MHRPRDRAAIALDLRAGVRGIRSHVSDEAPVDEPSRTGIDRVGRVPEGYVQIPLLEPGATGSLGCGITQVHDGVI